MTYLLKTLGGVLIVVWLVGCCVVDWLWCGWLWCAYTGMCEASVAVV